MVETDGVGETFDESLRIALTVASQFGERTSRLREQFARQREAGAREEYRELEARFEAERGAVRASLEPVKHAEWWDRARVEDIAETHGTATAWRNYDEVAREASESIRREVRERYGIDIERPGADPAAVAEALREAERDRDRANEERRRAREELTASEILLAGADRRDREADDATQRAWDADAAATGEEAERENANAGQDARVEQVESGTVYDSADRRQAFAASLEGKAGEKEIHARVLADGENAKHPREAVAAAPGRAAKPRGRSRTVTHERSRGGLSR
ncbi:hypothetical protein ACPW96_21315 [Micromonospora sp. DT81.3]|uniref:hypothetical protein n=1 Tax=Micromonospora sp. DT81.3 TaxID=3416523 RepID=UPI003CF41E39